MEFFGCGWGSDADSGGCCSDVRRESSRRDVALKGYSVRTAWTPNRAGDTGADRESSSARQDTQVGMKLALQQESLASIEDALENARTHVKRLASRVGHSVQVADLGGMTSANVTKYETSMELFFDTRVATFHVARGQLQVEDLEVDKRRLALLVGVTKKALARSRVSPELELDEQLETIKLLTEKVDLLLTLNQIARIPDDP